MSDTPRTDAHVMSMALAGGNHQIVFAHVARELERELAAAAAPAESAWGRKLLAQLDAVTAERDQAIRLAYVPGLWKCAKCKFSLTARVLYVQSGTVGANERPQDCANGCGPMWRVTERDAGNELCDRLEAITRKQRAGLTWAGGMEDAAELCDQEAHSAKALIAENPGARGEALARLEAIGECAEGLAATIRTFKASGRDDETAPPRPGEKPAIAQEAVRAYPSAANNTAIDPLYEAAVPNSTCKETGAAHAFAPRASGGLICLACGEQTKE